MTTALTTKNNPTVLRAWCMYDWANSVYSLVITSTIFPIYYGNVTKQADGNELVNFFGFSVKNTVLYSYSLSFSFLVILLLNIWLSAIADYGGLKKQMMQFFCTLGAVSCTAMWFFTGQNIEFGIMCFVLASIGFSGSIVFYNAYLPEIATEDRFDKLSARGFALGYIGSVVLLVLNLLPILQPAWFGNVEGGIAARLGFVATGVWWFGFAQYTFVHLPKTPRKTIHNWVENALKEIKKVINQLPNLPELKRFLVAFFLYNTGVQTTMYMATLFGQKELNLPSESLIITILLLQLIAIAGSYLFAFLSEKWGNIKTLLLIICVWVIVCITAYFVQTAFQFYGLAALVGMVMGGIQSLSRATYAKLIPAQTQDTASFFNFYDMVEKSSIIIGTAVYGIIEQLTGSMRSSALALCLFFMLGAWALSQIHLRKKRTSIK